MPRPNRPTRRPATPPPQVPPQLPPPAHAAAPPADVRVRLVEPTRPSPFLAGRDTVFARLAGDGLAALDLHDGDHVVLARRSAVEHGDIAAIVDLDGQVTLWKAYPEEGALRLATGRPGHERRLAPPPPIHGVVVAVLRKDA
ncbi:MAG: S24 family peptidase [Planctomycetia bacterium]